MSTVDTIRIDVNKVIAEYREQFPETSPHKYVKKHIPVMVQRLVKNGKITGDRNRLATLKKEVALKIDVLKDMKKEEQKKPVKVDHEKQLKTVLTFPDWETNTSIVNYIKFVKEVNGMMKEYIFGARYDNGKITVKKEHPDLCLPPDTLLSSDFFIKIKDEPEKGRVFFHELFDAFSERIGAFVYTDKINLTNAVLKVLASYFLDVFDTAPYTDLCSPEFGSGKTTFMMASVFASYHGIVYTNPTGPTVYRVMKDISVTLGIDEVDNLFKRQNDNPDIIAVVNSSNVKGTKVPRIDENNKIIFYDAFGPKYFTRVGSMPQSFYSRTDKVAMGQNLGKAKLRKHPLPVDFEDLRDRAYITRWFYMDEVQGIYNNLKGTGILQDRTEDIYLPLLVIAKIIDDEKIDLDSEFSSEFLFDQVLEHAKNQQKKFSLRSKDIYKQLMSEVLASNKKFRNEVKVITIRDSFNERLVNDGLVEKSKDGSYRKYSSRRIMSILDDLRFNRSSKKSGNNVHYDIIPEIQEDNERCYGINTSEDCEDCEDVGGLPSIANDTLSKSNLLAHIAQDLPQANIPNKANSLSSNIVAFLETDEDHEGRLADILNHFNYLKEEEILEVLDLLVTNGILYMPQAEKFKIIG